MLNRVEAAIRAYDPCLSCSTHAVGQMPIEVDILDPQGNCIQTVRRGSNRRGRHVSQPLERHSSPGVKRTLIFGYGNPDRQDDGVAWHVLVALAVRLGWQAPVDMEQEFPRLDGGPDLIYNLQLTPEFAEIAAGYQRVCFVDAHTGNIPYEIGVIEVKPEFQKSPFTHHMTPSTCLALAYTLYGGSPQAILVSIHGYEFGFVQSLSVRTQPLVEQTVEAIYAWLVGA